MKIWVDADACPNPAKNMLFKAAIRLKLELALVANHSIYIPSSPYIRLHQVEHGFDVADNFIVDQLCCGDVLISGDIPLAAQAIARGAYVLNTRGQVLDSNNIGQRLRVRNMLEEMRSIGQLEGGGPAPYKDSDLYQFANALDRLLTQLARE